jgi:transcriptional regulator with XRE-family HTH domain
MTQEALALEAGVSRNYVSQLELDQKSPTVKVLLKLCRALGVKASAIISRVESR